MRIRAFKYRIYPTKAQRIMFLKNFGCCRFVYNWALEQKNKFYLQGVKKTMHDLMRELPAMKEKLPWLKEATAQSLQQSLNSLDQSFIRFFRKESEFPKFKSRRKSKSSFHVPQGFKIDQENGFVILPKYGKVKSIIHRPFDGIPKSITISMTKAGSFFASVLVEIDEDDKPCAPIDPKTTIGIDLGLKSFIVTSDGRTFNNPKYLGKHLSKIRFLSRQHSKKVKGGKNREKARMRLARQHEKIANQRSDFLHKVSHQLANENQVGTICVEDLNVKGMMANHKLARSIGDASWGKFGRMLSYKCKWRGINLIQIGRFDPSSRLCPCGKVNKELTLSDRSWTCPSCGQVHDRDLLAAKNIKKFGLQRGNVVETLNGNLKKRKKNCGGTHRGKLGELPIRKLGASNQESATPHK